jgi:hypothetical protein
MQLLETSIDKVGVIESISVTQEGTIISGHARKEIFDKKGMVAKEIKLAENEYPVIVTEIEDNTKEYFEAQILANTTANKNFNLDIDVIEVIAEEYDIEIEEVGVEIYDYSISDESETNSASIDDKYTKKVAAPIYEPSAQKPILNELYNNEKFNSLIEEIESSDLIKEHKEFLKLCATRHIVFDYAKIADFYAHSEKNIQELMEKSALVIIDFNKAIENGYAKLSDEIAKQFESEYDGEI